MNDKYFLFSEEKMKKWLKHDVSNDFFLALAGLNWKMRKVFAIVCLIAILGSLLPNIQNTYAYSIPEDSKDVDEDLIDKDKYPTTTDDDFDVNQVELLGEIESMRTENTKTFQRVDGSYVVAMYSDTVHYQKDGKWENINNSLKYDTSDDSYSNLANKFSMKFPKNLDENKSIKLTMRDYSISWSISGISKSSIQLDESDLKSRNMKELTGINQEIFYGDVLDGVDIQYVLTGTKLKENIILQRYIKDFSMSFEYETKNLNLIFQEGQYLFVNDIGDTVFDLTDLYAVDSNGDISNAVSMKVINVNNGRYIITLSVDDYWLSKAKYPVTIDPSISSKVDNVSISDTYLKHTWLNVNSKYPTSTIISCNDGKPTLLSAAYLGYINFVVPSFLKNFDITYATLNLTSYSTTGYGTLYLHELQNYLYLSTLGWDTTRTVDSIIIDYAEIEGGNRTYKLDITSSVDKWNKLNYTYMPGFELKSDGEILKLYSTEYTTYKPTIEIGFMDSNGIKDYWTYTSHEVGNAGTGFISDFTQELNIVREDISFQTDLQSLGVSFAYNNNVSMSQNPNVGYGNGWNINFNMTLHVGEASASYYTKDYTGNRSYFSLSTCDSRMDDGDYDSYSCYVSEDGTGDNVVKHLDEYGQQDQIFLLSKDNTKYVFVNNYLDNISNLDNLLITTIIRNPSYPNLVEEVYDYTGNVIDFVYVNGNLDSATLKTIEGGTLHILEKVYYKYYGTTNYLHDIYYMTNYNQNKNLSLNINNLSNVDKIARYDHYITKQMSRVYMEFVNETTGVLTYGEDVRYHYLTSESSQISNYESYFDSTKVSQINYDSSLKQTLISDHNGNFVLYKFDNYGHTVNVIDDHGNAIFHEYLDIFVNPSTLVNGKYNYDNNHKIVNQSSPQKSVHNPIKNNGFESLLSNWTAYSGAGANFSTVSGSDYVKTGKSSLRIHTTGSEYGYVYQSITLDKGIHNFTVDVKNCGQDTDAVYISINDDFQLVDNDGEWHRLTFTEYVLESDTLVNIKLYSSTTGDVYFDNISYYNDFESSRVNLIENSSFENGLARWYVDQSVDTVYNFYSLNGGTGTLDSLFQKILGNTAIGLNGRITQTLKKNYFEDIVEYGGKLYVGGWAYNYSAPLVNNANLTDYKSFRIYIEQTDAYGNEISFAQEINFNLEYNSWQFVFDEVTVAPTCEFLNISFEYFGEGEVVFDGLSVFYISNSTRYEYDTFGRVIEVYQGTKNTYSLTYPAWDEGLSIYPEYIEDDNNNEIQIVQEFNSIIEIISDNVKSTSDYNDFGQVYSVQLRSGNGYIQYFDTSTEYTSNTSQYVSSTTDEFDNTTYYYYNEITGLIDHISNSKDVAQYYEYYDNGLLKKLYIEVSQTGETSNVVYTYNDKDQLITIRLADDYSYSITYDELGRIWKILINNVPLVTYNYKLDTYETNLIEEKIFGNNDKMIYVYDENDLITEIQFQGAGSAVISKFKYKYDSYGRVVEYQDLINNINEKYEYNLSGNLIKIISGEDESIDYEYDLNGKLAKAIYSIDGYNSTVEYDYIEDGFNPNQYDKTTFSMTNSTVLTKEFFYTNDNYIDDPIGRLLKVRFFLTGVGNFSQYYSYEANTYRINQTTYFFGENDSRNIKYEYRYDSLGNIIEEKTSSFDSINGVYFVSSLKSYEYDDLNQLVTEDVLFPTNQSASFTNIYYYDSRGNRTDVKTFLYGQDDYNSYSIPSFYENSTGLINVKAYYNNTFDCYDIYELEIGETPTISIDLFNLDLGTWITGIILVDETFSTLNINQEGYYYSYFTASCKLSIYTEFRIVFKVGNPIEGPVIPKNHIHYNYNSDWEDQLLSYGEIDYINGVPQTEATVQEYTYDEQGNPTYITNFIFDGVSYNHAILNWDGRELSKISVYSSSGNNTLASEICYTYNDQGYRVSKTLDSDGNGVEDKKYIYLLSSDLVLAEKVSKYVNNSWVEDYQINYLYEHDDSAVGFELFKDGVYHHYLYVKNLQGDITQIIQANGSIVVEYFYDSFGEILQVTGALSESIGDYNSLRYRSYKYDNELNLYYLNSRYYNPEIGRFISSDGHIGEIGNILSTNMYAYCANNPVMYTDVTGYFMVGVMITSIIVSLVFECVEDYTDDGIINGGWNYFGAAVSGFFSGLSGGFGALVMYSFIGNSLDYFISGNYNSNTFGQDMLVMGISSVIGVGVGKLLKYGVSKLKANSLFKLSNNSLANSLLDKMGLNINIGSNVAKTNLAGIIYGSSKYFLGEVIESIGSNVSNNGLLLIFD